jgi:peptidoglycan/xylan/chitin deacetylase (PgdA/CDA1 family)
MCNRLHPLHPDDQESALRTLRGWSGIDAEGRESHRVLSREEIRLLTDGELIDVGAHTVRHPLLGRLSVAEQQWEIRRSKSVLEEILGREVVGFSYPFGYRGAYTRQTTRLVREAGLEFACANFESAPDRRTSLFQLPRFLVRDWDGDHFAQQLRRWFHDSERP